MSSTNAVNGRDPTVPAHSISAEQNVLGSILTDPAQWERVAPLLDESTFYRPDHQLIWRAIATLRGNGKLADLVTVTEYLTLGNELEAAGGLAYIGRLTRDTILPSNSLMYAEIVRSHAQSRALVDIGNLLIHPDGTPAEKKQQAIARLGEIRIDGRAPPAEALNLLRGADVQMQPTDWLWNEWLAAACLQVFAGPAGLGKTTISLSLAATVTSGRLWPDGSRCCNPGSVIFWSGEDAIDKTLMPRFTAMGGNPERIYFVDAVTVRADGGLETREFDPSRDIPLLIEKAREIGDVRLLVVDPVSMCVAGDSNKNAEVRRGLAPLKTFAERHGAAVLGVSHFSKGSEGRDPLSRVTGSLAFGAAPRLVLSAVTENPKPEEPDDAEPRFLFVRTKSNLGPTGDGFRYTVEQAVIPGEITASRIVWGEHLKGAARELLADAEQTEMPGDHTAKADAERFLTEMLSGGPLEAKAIFAEARQAGHSQRTVERAKAALRVQASRDGSARPPRWLWQLPEQGRQPSAQHRQSQNLGGLGGLGGVDVNSVSYEGLLPPQMSKAANAATLGESGSAGGVATDREAF